VLALFVARFSGILAALLFLPAYHELLGDAYFGIYAIVMGIQAFGLMVDGGLSVIVSRSAAADSNKEYKQIFKLSLKYLTRVYLIFLVVSACFVVVAPEYFSLIVLTLLLTFFVVIQNIRVSCLVGLGLRLNAALELSLSSFLRPLAGYIALNYLEVSVESVVGAQLIVAVMLVLPILLTTFRQKDANARDVKSVFSNVKRLVFTGISGAAVTQLDKSVLGLFFSPEGVSPYFLAMTICMVPVSTIGIVLHYYFQPKISKYYAAENVRAVESNLQVFLSCLVLSIAIVFVSYQLLIEWFLMEWLGDARLVGTVREFCDFFIIANLFAMFSFLGFSVLNAAEDYKFQSISASILAVSFLICLSILADLGEIELICWLVVMYHIVSFLITSLRGGYIVWRLKNV
jgi:O-antigen/teichoic acid export membrane protein